MKREIVLAALIGLSGCTEFNAASSAASSYASTEVSAQVLNIQAANDVVAKTWASSACAFSYGELVRNGSGNPNFAEAVINLCGGPSGYTMIHGTNITVYKPNGTTTMPITSTVP